MGLPTIDNAELPAQYIDLCSGRFAFTEAGAESGAGAAVILLHGWMCNRGFWAATVRALADDFHVFALDCRGHGESARPARGYTIADLASDVHDFVMHKRLGPVTVIGHSMGGMVAQQLAVAYPGAMQALGLITTVAADPDHQLISQKIIRDCEHVGFAAAFDRHFPGWFGPAADRRVVAWVKAQMLLTDPAVAVQLARDYRAFDLRDRLAQINVPTLVVAGSDDQSAAPVQSAALADLIPGARLTTLAPIGHFPMLETPDELAAALNEFLHAFAA